MPDPRNPFNYPINPQFGKGIYRRRIRLTQHHDHVMGQLEDCNHGFEVSVFHDGEKITRVEGIHHRIPFSSCGGAIEPLQTLTGTPLGLSSIALSSLVNARSHCTHWLDLALLAILHIGRDECVRTYEIEVPDETDSPTTAKVFCNEQLMHEWQVKDWQLYAPNTIAGQTLFKGFSAWANTAFDNEESRQAAFALQKGYFVARARRFDMDKLAGESAKVHTMMAGACFTYSEPRASHAHRTSHSTRDFTHSAEELLLFK